MYIVVWQAFTKSLNFISANIFDPKDSIMPKIKKKIDRLAMPQMHCSFI